MRGGLLGQHEARRRTDEPNMAPALILHAFWLTGVRRGKRRRPSLAGRSAGALMLATTGRSGSAVGVCQTAPGSPHAWPGLALAPPLTHALPPYSGSIRNGWIGRQLPRLFKEQGLEVISVDPVQVFVHLALAELFLGNHLAQLQESGTLSPDQDGSGGSTCNRRTTTELF
jgi:hypothetical protein